MARQKSNVERIRQPVPWRLPLRIALVLGGVAAGIALALALTPRGDTLAFDVGLVRGALLGLLLGAVAAGLVPNRGARPPSAPPKIRPSGFDALRVEMEQQRATTPVGDAAEVRADGRAVAKDDGRVPGEAG
ncbi:hypothetical protein [Egicoccus sp. AB-alg2]|uniref:hypothetical protein n=1 Tax=Egicoccus sp. AB-alg2 TaxID=3242693 RepID=UPI00359EE6E7